MKKIFLILIIIFNLKAEKSAIVNIDFKNSPKQEVSDLLFGTFIEYFMCFDNNGLGMYAQDFINRGFDISKNKNSNTLAAGWDVWNAYHGELPEWKLEEGGYNENAIYYQKVTNLSDSGSVGIHQNIFNTENTGLDFYVWAKSPDFTGKLKFSVWSKYLGTKLFEITSDDSVSKDWNKFECRFPELEGYEQLDILISFEGKGEVHFDEASIMPSNNVNGVRKYFYDAYKRWSPTILRYPGGWFVEYTGYVWNMAIGDVDKRPVKKGYENVRVDFGIHEFILFCKSLNIEPHITFSYFNNTPQTAANLVEYCNGSVDTEYGTLRAKHSSIEPYNVKFFEIGNEIWQDPKQYATDYISFYDSVKSKDPDITCIVSGDIWHGSEFIDEEIEIIKDKSDVYGWHWAQPNIPFENATNEEIYLSMVAGSEHTQLDIDKVQKVIDKYHLEGEISQGITELWATFNPDTHDWIIDTTYFGGSLSNGLWMADQMITIINNSKYISINEKTASMSTIRTFVNDDNKRIFYTVPSYLTNIMINNHRGNKLLKADVSCETISNRYIEGLFNVNDVNLLNVNATHTDDTLYVYLLNRSPNEQMNTYINIPERFIGFTGREYMLYSKDFMDANTPAAPENIKIISNNITIGNYYTIPAHSFVILAIPVDTTLDIAQASEDIKLFPNPFNDKILVSEFTEMPELIEMYNINGQLVKTVEFEELKSNVINTKNLQNGIYFVKIVINNETKILKLVKA